MDLKNNIKITVITATLNSDKFITSLAKSIKNQTDMRFYWLIQDGVSTDKTLEKIKQFNLDNVKIFIEKDSGIYDAYNKAVKNCTTQYYLFVGSDDELNLDAIENFNNCLKINNYDLIATKWKSGKTIYRPYKNLGWLKGMHGVSSSHSVATLIKKSLHDSHGLYSLSFPICADALFIKKCVYSGCKIYYANFISGTFAIGGFSSKDIFKTLKEAYEIQRITEKNLFIQKIIYIMKIIKVKYLIR